MRRIYAIKEWCVDCKRCEVACKTAHSSSKDTVKAYTLEKESLISRIRVEGDTVLSIAINCRHCADPKCVRGCISGAMTKDPISGIVTSNPDKCVGCRTCVSMCPFGAVSVEMVATHNAAKGAVYARAVKCDMCGAILGQAGDPKCVEACPNRALIYIESKS